MKFFEIFGLSFLLCIAVVGAMSPRILGGDIATEGQFPYQISLRQNDQLVCSGSIISNNYILTAAHCVTNLQDEKYDASEFSIRAGTIKHDSGGVLVDVTEITVHPKFSFPRFDVALLKLATPLEYTNTIKPIGLVKDAVPDGATILASGWGYLSTNGVAPTELQYVYLNAVGGKKCRGYSTVLCVKSRRGQGICQGDSGGPGVYNGELAGVVSFTAGRCGSDRPDGFAKISVLRDWIVENSDLE